MFRGKSEASDEPTNRRCSVFLQGVACWRLQCAERKQSPLRGEAPESILVARIELKQEVVELILDARSLADQLLTFGGEETEKRGLVVRLDLRKRTLFLAHDPRHGGCIEIVRLISLASTEPATGSEPGVHLEHALARCNEMLR
jgi:hypothetical protein